MESSRADKSRIRWLFPVPRRRGPGEAGLRLYTAAKSSAAGELSRAREQMPAFGHSAAVVFQKRRQGAVGRSGPQRESIVSANPGGAGRADQPRRSQDALVEVASPYSRVVAQVGSREAQMLRFWGCQPSLKVRHVPHWGRTPHVEQHSCKPEEGAYGQAWCGRACRRANVMVVVVPEQIREAGPTTITAQGGNREAPRHQTVPKVHTLHTKGVEKVAAWLLEAAAKTELELVVSLGGSLVVPTVVTNGHIIGGDAEVERAGELTDGAEEYSGCAGGMGTGLTDRCAERQADGGSARRTDRWGEQQVGGWSVRRTALGTTKSFQ
ncbi:hypothetical protein QBC39DRAFT_434724 [Podospora conica]|nr:hypothetical protein QBC39DRAFT_434724 [Schizothecium conicum]